MDGDANREAWQQRQMADRDHIQKTMWQKATTFFHSIVAPASSSAAIDNARSSSAASSSSSAPPAYSSASQPLPVPTLDRMYDDDGVESASVAEARLTLSFPSARHPEATQSMSSSAGPLRSMFALLEAHNSDDSSVCDRTLAIVRTGRAGRMDLRPILLAMLSPQMQDAIEKVQQALGVLEPMADACIKAAEAEFGVFRASADRVSATGGRHRDLVTKLQSEYHAMIQFLELLTNSCANIGQLDDTIVRQQVLRDQFALTSTRWNGLFAGQVLFDKLAAKQAPDEPMSSAAPRSASTPPASTQSPSPPPPAATNAASSSSAPRVKRKYVRRTHQPTRRSSSPAIGTRTRLSTHTNAVVVAAAAWEMSDRNSALLAVTKKRQAEQQLEEDADASKKKQHNEDA